MPQAGQQRRCPGCRITLISRYNIEPLCGPCLRAARHSSVAVPVWLWDSEPMRAALARLDMAAVVTILRTSAGLTQQELGALVPGWTKLKVTRIEAGDRDTLYDIRELLAFADAVQMPREALLPVVMSDANVAVEPPPDHEQDEDVDRRTFNGSLLSVAAGSLLLSGRGPTPAQAGIAHVRYLEACVQELWARDWAVGGGALLRQAVGLFRQARVLLDDSDYTERIGQGLLNAGAQLGVCGSFIAFDAGDLPLARGLAYEARLLADNAGDPTLSAHLLVTMALQSTALARMSKRGGPAREALRLLEHAGDLARHEPSPKLHALIDIRRATAAALLDDSRTVSQSLNSARRSLDRGAHPTDRPWFAFVTPTEITGHQARAAADLARPEDAVDLYDEVLQDTSLPPRNKAYYQGLLAEARLQAGDVQGALTTGQTALAALEGRVTSVRTLDTLRSLRPHDEVFQGRFDAIAHTMNVQ